MPHCRQPLPLDDLVSYWQGELPPAREEAIEEHLFSCEECGEQLQSIERLGRSVADLFSSGSVAGTHSASVLERAAADGLHLRIYEIEPSGTVSCTAAPEDLLVAVRLKLDADVGGERVDVSIQQENLETGAVEHATLEDAVVGGPEGKEIVFLNPGDIVRAYARTFWTIRVLSWKGSESRVVGTYHLDHTPWEQLEHPRS